MFESQGQAKEALITKIATDWSEKKSKDAHVQRELYKMMSSGLRLCKMDELLNMLKPKERKNYKVEPIDYKHK